MLPVFFLVAAKWNSLTPQLSIWGSVSSPTCEASIVTEHRSISLGSPAPLGGHTGLFSEGQGPGQHPDKGWLGVSPNSSKMT